MTYRKYHNIKCSYNGIKFDSKKECNRFIELDMLQNAGLIKDLKLQVKFEICPKRYGNKRARYYIADFTYTEGEKLVIEDVKSPITRTNPVYSLKKALVLVNYPEYEFREY